MPINSSQLLAELRHFTDLTLRDIQATMNSAHYGPDGNLDGIDGELLVQKGTQQQLARFFTAAGALHPVYGGLAGGYVVHPDHYPTGRDDPPCVPRDNAYCWARPSWQP